MPLKLHTKVAVCIPSGPEWDAEFSMCLVNLFAHVLTRPMKGVRQIHMVMINERTSLLPKSRQSLLERAISLEADFALFLDTDQTFPSNTLYRLLHWKMPVVACNIATKSIPASPTARTYNPMHKGGDVVYSDPEKHGLEDVWRVGTGIMLVDLEAVKRIPKPWFSVVYDAEQQEFIGEDWFFCQKLQAAGIQIYIDHDLSREIGHRGLLTYTHELVGKVVEVGANGVCKGAFLESSKDDPSVPVCSACKQPAEAHK